MNTVGIRSEQKHWDSRVSVSPEDIKSLPASIHICIEDNGKRRLPFKPRVFSNEAYLEAGKCGGATTAIVDSLENCRVIIGTKEIKEVSLYVPEEVLGLLEGMRAKLQEQVPPVAIDKKLGAVFLTDFVTPEEANRLQALTANTPAERFVALLLQKQKHLVYPGKAYLFFSHTHKGQPYNMRMLHEFIERQCTLLDYELLREECGGNQKRTVSYGRWAGIVGVLDTLWAYGEHLYRKAGIDHPFRALRSGVCYDSEKCEYRSVDAARTQVGAIARQMRANGLPFPVKVGVAGFGGEVGGGALEVLSQWDLPMVEVDADQFLNPDFRDAYVFEPDRIYLIKLHYHHLYRPKAGSDISDSQIRTTLKSGKGFLLESNLDKYFLSLTIFLNCISWNKECPRLLTNAFLKKAFDLRNERALKVLPVIGDITCDPNGSIQCCRDTYPDRPVYMWSPEQSEEPILPDFDIKSVGDDFEYFDLSRDGFVLMTVTNLPCEIPHDASARFSRDFCKKRVDLDGKSYLECLAEADFGRAFADCGLPQPMKDAVILYKGRFNPTNPQVLFKEICLALIETGVIKTEQVLPMLL